MSAKIWIRWASMHAGPRVLMKLEARRGHPLGKIILGGGGDQRALVEDIRSRGRLFRTPFTWVTADHELTRSMLRDSRFGVTSPENIEVPAFAKWLLRKTELDVANPVEPPSMLMVDPPQHTRYRKAVAKTFTPRAIARLEDRIDEVTRDLLAALEQKDSAELIFEYAAQLPVAVIAEMLGIPEDVRPHLLDWGNGGAPLLDIGLPWKVYRDAISTLDDVTASIHDTIDRGDDEDHSILADLALNGGLDRREVAANAAILIGAGFETTVNLIGNGVVLLLQHPDQLQLLRDQPDLWPNAVEEILRYDSPVQMTARTALSDVEVGGQQIRAGAMVAMLLSGANRDPAVFTDPAEFDITRPNAKDHLSFSTGIHACLGAHLARTEGVVALRSLFERFPDLRIDGELNRRDLRVLHGFERLPVTLGRAVHVDTSDRPALIG